MNEHRAGDFLRAQIMGPVFQLGFAAQFLGIAESALNFAANSINKHARRSVLGIQPPPISSR